MKKCIGCALALTTGIFTFVPESTFGYIKFISEDLVNSFNWIGCIYLEANIVINRVIFLIIIWIITAIIYKGYLHFRNKVTINGDNYSITIEYGDLLEIKNCKRIINFDECFTTQVGNDPSDVKSTSICGQYLLANPNLDIDELIKKSKVKSLKTKSRYNGKERYQSGTIISNNDDLLMAFAKLDKDGSGRFFTRDEYLECLSLLWKEINKHYGQKDVCIPILGAGITRFEDASGASISQKELLNMIILSYKLSSHKIKSPQKLRIICKKQEGFSLNEIFY